MLPFTDKRGAQTVAEQLRREVESLSIPHRQSDVSPVVTASLGTATVIPTLEMTSHELLLQADKALYQAKKKTDETGSKPMNPPKRSCALFFIEEKGVFILKQIGCGLRQ